MEIISMLNSTIISPVNSVISSPIFNVSFFLMTSGLSVFIENKYNLLNRITKFKSCIRNKNAEIKISITYKPKKEFDLIKKALKDYFINEYKEYSVLNEKLTYITLNFDIFTVKVIRNEFGEIFFDFYKTGCGINDLNAKVVKLISTLKEIDRTQKLFERLINCDIVIYLPYNWANIKIDPPEGFELKKYLVELQDNEDRYRTKVGVHLNSINASGNSFEEIISLLQKLL